MKRKTISIFCLLILILSIAPVAWLFSVSYDEFCRLILTRSGKLYKLAEFQDRYLTPTRFLLLRALAGIMPFLLTGFLFFVTRNRFVQRKWRDFLFGAGYLFALLKKGAANIPATERFVIGAFFSAFTLRTVYHAVTSPVTSDEAWTYLTFISRGLPVSMSLNYSPNNHILYSILSCFSFYLPFDPTFNMRLPSVLITIACCLIFFICIRLLFNTLTAFLTTSMLASLYPFMYYSLQARGYLLITLLFAFCFFALTGIIKSGRREFWLIYTVASVLGAYTIPSFLYPFVSLSLFAFVYFVYERRFSEIKNLIYCGATVGIVVFVLYLPVFAMSGVSAVIANEYVQPISRAVVLQKFPEYTMQLLGWLFGSLFIGLILFACSPLVKSPKNNLLVKMSFFCFLIVPLLCILHSVLPYVRVWIYLTIAAAAGTALTFDKIIARFNLNIWAVSMLCLIVLGLGEYNYQSRLAADEYESRAAKANRYRQFLADENLKSFYVEEDSTSIYMDYYLTTNRRNYQMHYGFAESFDPAKNYDCLVLKADNSAALGIDGYQLIYADDISKIFVKSR